MICEVLDFYNLMDGIQQQLLEKEKYWNKCNPCKNKGACCKNSESMIFPMEYEVLKEFLNKLPKERIMVLKKHIEENILCPFQTENECLIHDIRPTVCRLTPFSCNIQNGKIYYPVDNSFCYGNFYEQDFYNESYKRSFLNDTFVELTVSYDGKVRTYINTDNLKIKYPILQKMCEEKPISLMDFLKNFIKNSNDL